VLQTTKRFDRLALVNLIQSIITAALIFAAFLFQGNVWHVLVAYLLGKTFAGVAVAVSAFRQLDVTLGRGWWKTSLSLLPDWKKVGRFAISTNLSGTVNLIVRDSETLIISFFMSTTEAGYFRLAQGIINLVMMPIDPFIGPIYSEVTRTVAEQQWATTRRLLKRVSAIAGAWTLAIGSGLALLGWWLIPFLYGSGTAPTYPALLILLIGYGIANTFQWNRSLLLAMGMATFPLVVAALAGLVKTALSFTLVPIAGYLTEAGILSAYFVVSIGILVWQGLRVLNRQSAIANQP
jgi:O-antigen/teichoic acid export membrane protein